MGYLSVKNFWHYQNADVWKKSKGHPPWFKHYVSRDRELDDLPAAARLLYWELVATASRYSNVLKDDLEWLWAETRVEREAIAEMLPLLLKGGWLSQTSTPRRSRKPSRETREDPRDLIEEEEERDKNKEQEPTTAPARLRPVDPVWDFVAHLEGEPLDRYRKARGRIVADLRTLSEGDVYEIARRHDALAREWGDAKATARALVQNWHRAGQMAAGQMRGPQRTDGRVSADELYASARPAPEPEGRRELEAG